MEENKVNSAENNLVFMENGRAVGPNAFREALKTPLIKRLAVALLLLVITVIIAIIAASAGWLSVERISLKFFDWGKGRSISDNMPMEMNGLKVLEIDDIGYCFGVLDDLKYSIYSPEGNEVYSFNHNMANPVTVSSDRRVAMFERGNYKISVFSRKGEIFTKKTEHEIISADIDRKNSLAVATAGDRYLGQVTVYDPSGNEKLTWYSAEGYITDVCLSDDGKQFAVSLLRVENGDDISRICIFNVGDSEPVADFSFENDTVFDLRRCGEDGFVALGTGSASFFNTRGEMIGRYTFDGKLLSNFTVTDNRAVLVFSADEGKAECISLQGEKICEISIEKPDGIYGSTDGSFFVISGGKITEYVATEPNTYSENTVKPTSEAIKVLQKDGKLLILSIGGIDILNLNEEES